MATAAKLQVARAYQFLYTPKLGEVRHRYCYGGRGGGKSHAFAEALIVLGTLTPLRILCAREIQNSIKDSVKRLLEDKIEAHGLGVGIGGSGFYTSTDTEIRGANGTVFLFVGLWSRPDSVKSMEGIDVCWIEEANTVSQRSIDLILPTIRKPGSELWWTWNPRFETDPVDKMFRGGLLPPKAIGGVVNWDQNPWFPEVLRDEKEWDRNRDPDKYAHVWLGDYLRASEATVFRNWRVEDFEPEPHWIWDYGADWGYSVDPTAGGRASLQGRTLYVDHIVHAVLCPIDQLPALFAGSDTKDPPRWENPKGYVGLPEALKWEIRADNARPETIAYMKQRSFRMSASTKGAGSVDEGYEFLKSVDIVVHSRCKQLIDELTLRSYETDKLTGVVLPKLKSGQSDHHIDWLRYALELRRKAKPDKPPVGPVTVDRASPYVGVARG
jgi:phage terminase large subunit